MSIDLNWETLTGGPDGAELAEHIRDFIHTKFQSVPLPRFIKSVTVHDFQFGRIPPDIVLKDICDPLPDFYEENEDLEETDSEDEAASQQPVDTPGNAEDVPDAIRAAERRRRAEQSRRLMHDRGGHGSAPATPTGEFPFPTQLHGGGFRSMGQTPEPMGTPFIGLGASTPGIPGGASNMHYLHSKLGTGWSGTHTPLAAVAGAQHQLNGAGPSMQLHSPPLPQRSNIPEHHRNPSHGSVLSVSDYSPRVPMPSTPPPQPSQLDSLRLRPFLKEKHSVSTLAPTSAGASRPPTRDALAGSAIEDYDDESDSLGDDGRDGIHLRSEPRVDDMQAVFRIKYAGDVKLMLTAEILLDYPMPSFVGIPVKLNITGLTFDGVGVLANIRKRVHFCFLSPEGALAAVGRDDEDDAGGNGQNAYGESDGGLTEGQRRSNQREGGSRLGGLLQEIRVESEIGQREGTKQSLKNVGKVERFVLEQVRRIFEEEFVYPSFWTFLV